MASPRTELFYNLEFKARSEWSIWHKGYESETLARKEIKRLQAWWKKHGMTVHDMRVIKVIETREVL